MGPVGISEAKPGLCCDHCELWSWAPSPPCPWKGAVCKSVGTGGRLRSGISGDSDPIRLTLSCEEPASVSLHSPTAPAAMLPVGVAFGGGPGTCAETVRKKGKPHSV